MNIFDLGDCLPFIFKFLDFDSLRELRKTCLFFKSYPLSGAERTIIKCGTCYEPEENKVIKCNHYNCADLIVERVKSRKTTFVEFEDDETEVSYAYRYLFFKFNPQSIHEFEIRNIFEVGISSEDIPMVMDTYQLVFEKLREWYNYYRENPNYDEEIGDYEVVNIYALDVIYESKYYCRALANFGDYFEIPLFQEKLDIKNYLPWNDEEGYIGYYELEEEEVKKYYLGKVDEIFHNIDEIGF